MKTVSTAALNLVHELTGVEKEKAHLMNDRLLAYAAPLPACLAAVRAIKHEFLQQAFGTQNPGMKVLLPWHAAAEFLQAELAFEVFALSLIGEETDEAIITTRVTEAARPIIAQVVAASGL